MIAGRSRIVECVVVCLAIAVRVAAVLVLQSHHVPRSTYEHGEIAANLLAGKGFSIKFLGAAGPTSQQAPIYPAVVALAYAVGGVETPQSLLLIELGQSLLGGILVWGVIRLARMIAPTREWLGPSAGLIVALHPALVYSATHVQVASLGATLLTWTLLSAYRTGRRGRIRDALGTGGMLALLALTDPILALAATGVIGAIRLDRRDSPARGLSGYRLIAITFIVAAMGIAPWLVRNYRVHGEFVAIKSTFGYAFWQGNCALSEGTDKVARASIEPILDRGRNAGGLKQWNRAIWEARHEAGYIDDIALSKSDLRDLGLAAEPERSRILYKRAIADLKSQPGRYLGLCLRRLRYFLLFDETNPKSRVLIYRASHLGLSALALAGLLLAGPAIRKRFVPTIVTAMAITLFHSLTIVSARFHIPIEPLMAIWGAFALTTLTSTANDSVPGVLGELPINLDWRPRRTRPDRRQPAYRRGTQPIRPCPAPARAPCTGPGSSPSHPR